MNDQSNSDPGPRPEGEPPKQVQRSAGHVAVQATEIVGAGAGLKLTGLVVTDLYGQAKDKLGLGRSKPSDPKD